MISYYSVYDKKSGSFSPLLPAPTREVFLRSLVSALASNMSNPYVTYPEDFDVYLIGTFDESEGAFYEFDRELVCGMEEVVSRIKKLLGRSEKENDREESSLLN